MKKLGSPLVRHSLRQGNKVAHVLYRLGCKLTQTDNLRILLSPLDIVKKKLQADQLGASSSKIVLWSIYNNVARYDNLSVIESTNSYNIMSVYICSIMVYL